MKKKQISKNKSIVFNEYKAEKLLSNFLPIAKSQLVKTLREIKLKTPFYLKIISDDALHKTEIKGVRFVENSSELEKNFNELLETAKKRKIKLDGILVQEKFEGRECIIGIKKDPAFNHVILFGLGGTFTEIFEDISIRKCPISLKDAEEMIDELKSSKLFKEYRGQKVNTSLLQKTLVNISQIPQKYKNIQELDINPFIINEKAGKVADARIIFSQ